MKKVKELIRELNHKNSKLLSLQARLQSYIQLNIELGK